jgi:hypothetical protein
MDAISPMLQFCIGSRFARTATFDGGVKNQEGDAVAAGSAVPNTSDGGAGACSGDAGTGSAGNFTGGFIIGTGSGRSFTGSSGAGEGSIGVFTGSGLPITGSHAGGEVPLLLSRVLVMAEPVPILAGKFRRRFHRFRRCRGGGICTGGIPAPSTGQKWPEYKTANRISAHGRHGSSRSFPKRQQRTVNSGL